VEKQRVSAKSFQETRHPVNGYLTGSGFGAAVYPYYSNEKLLPRNTYLVLSAYLILVENTKINHTFGVLTDI
jgi:hypothetical protein